MKIPADLQARQDLYEDLVRKCMTSQSTRMEEYNAMRSYYLFGGTDDPAEYNKIQPHIDTLTSFMFAADTTKFSVTLGATADRHETEKIETLNAYLMDEWFNSNGDLVFSNALTWAMVYNTTLVKLIWNRGMHPFMVEPHCFGVLREDVPYLDRQEAMCHEYYISEAELARLLTGHKQKDEILRSVQPQEVTPNNSDGLQRIILSSSQPNMVGSLNTPFTPRNDYLPKVDEPLVLMQELWLWDDDEEDYRVVTQANGSVTVFDRPNFWMKGEHPFIQICPNPLYNYFWGQSETAKLTGLQDMRTWRVRQIRELLDKQAKPPIGFSGMMGITDEKVYAYNMAGGYMDMGDSPMAKMNPYPPTISQDLFAEVRAIDEMFSEASGLQNVMMGRAEHGVRSGRQTSELARLGSSRAKKRALVIEDALEKMATLYMKGLKIYSKASLETDTGLTFIPEQFTDDFLVKVDAHSNSPIFVEDHRDMAMELMKAKAIDRQMFIEILNPPMKQLMKERLKVIEAKEEKAQQMQQQAEMMKNAGKQGG